MPPPPQQQTTPGRSRGECATLGCAFHACLLIVAGVVAFFAWLTVHPHWPRFTVASLSVSATQVVFNLSARNPNRRFGVYYGGDTRAALLFRDAPVASGQAPPAGDWRYQYHYQPPMSTTSVAGVLDIVDTSFDAALRGRLPVRLQLTTGISFGLGVFLSVDRWLHVSCDLLVGAHGSLLRESVGAPCDSHFGLLEVED